jgi:hypothetical protein
MLTENVKRSMIFASVACMAALIAACSSSSDRSTAASPSALSPATSASSGGRLGAFAVGDTTTSTPEAGMIKVCKVGNVNGTFTISNISGGAPPTLISSPFTVATTVCRVVATDTSVAPTLAALVAVTETSAGLVSATIQPQGGVPAPYLGTAQVNAIHGATITFNNFVAPPPPPVPCTFTQGYWKNHPDAWKVTSLKLGSVTYTKAQLLDILDTPPKGNGLISLAHQLIAAKLNGATSATAVIGPTIAAADALIDGKVVPPVGSGFLDPSVTDALTTALDNWNSGITGPGECVS